MSDLMNQPMDFPPPIQHVDLDVKPQTGAMSQQCAPTTTTIDQQLAIHLASMWQNSCLGFSWPHVKVSLDKTSITIDVQLCADCVIIGPNEVKGEVVTGKQDGAKFSPPDLAYWFMLTYMHTTKVLSSIFSWLNATFCLRSLCCASSLLSSWTGTSKQFFISLEALHTKCCLRSPLDVWANASQKAVHKDIQIIVHQWN